MTNKLKEVTSGKNQQVNEPNTFNDDVLTILMRISGGLDRIATQLSRQNDTQEYQSDIQARYNNTGKQQNLILQEIHNELAVIAGSKVAKGNQI